MCQSRVSEQSRYIMKKILLLIVLSLAFFNAEYNANAQIQTKFWGLDLAKSYSSLKAVRDFISDDCEYAVIEGNNIRALNGDFGGYKWGLVNFQFHKRNKYALYGVEFSDNFNTKRAAEVLFDQLYLSLTEKYGDVDELSDEKDDTICLWADMKNCCFLRLINGESQGGVTYWYVILYYCNRDLLNFITQEGVDEL